MVIPIVDGEVNIWVSVTTLPGFRYISMNMAEGDEKDTVVFESRKEVEDAIAALRKALDMWEEPVR